ncbi:MAG: polysaccharide biosynthesis C-terminal domain-containing protein [Spirochaetales bacterium]|nr:polysaccharide biosynthesis C-terminal domain-containing protein [Spirochaetales bacterium]
MKDISGKFDWRRFLKNVAIIAIPVALQNLMTSTGTMVDTMMIARVGETAVGAVGLCSQYSVLMLGCYWGFVGGGMLFISQYWGAQDDEGICRSYGLMLCCIMSVAVIFSSVALFAPQFIMRLYTDKVSIQEIGIQYLKIAGFSYPLALFSISASTLLRATERVRIPLYAAIGSVLSNIFLNWCLIYGNLGFPALGVRGAAIATVAAAGINLSIIFICCAATRYPYIFRIKAHFKWVGAKVREFFIKCLPIILNEVFLGAGNMTVNAVLGRQSESAIAALAVFRTLEGFIISFFAGFSSSASVLVGKSVGAGNLEEGYQKAKRIMPLCVITVAFVGLLINLLKPNILHIMSLSGASFEIASYIIMVFMFVAMIRMGNWCMNDTFRSAGDSVTGTTLELVFMYIMVIPVVCITGLKLKVSIYLLFPLVYCDEIIRFIIMTVHLFSGRFIRPVTPQGKAALSEFRSSLRARRQR